MIIAPAVRSAHHDDGHTMVNDGDETKQYADEWNGMDDGFDIKKRLITYYYQKQRCMHL